MAFHISGRLMPTGRLKMRASAPKPVNHAPAWTTASGSLGSFTGGSTYSSTLVATDPDAGDHLTYSIASGSLPSGITLAPTTGVLSGPLPNPSISAPTMSTTVVINTVSTVVASGGSLGSFARAPSTNLTFQFTGIVDAARTVHSYITSGSLPYGLALNPATGLLSGAIAAAASSSTYSISIQVIDSLYQISTPYTVKITVP